MQEILSALQSTPAALAQLTRLGHGIEKESLRVTLDGQLADTTHPSALGSALTHPHITTDFCEAQPELITNVHRAADGCIAELEDVHRYLYAHLGDELLWSASMPCIVRDDADIPVGRYGSSNIARAKTVYRLGLGNRYGRLMQTISGIHYNFSLPDEFWPLLAQARGVAMSDDFATGCYLDLIRNFRRDSWLLIYLFGASPALCKSFVKTTEHNLQELDGGSLYLPHATSLRMGRLGYQSDAQANLHVSYNTLEEYAHTLREGLSTPYPPYEKFSGMKDGEYQQLSPALLQIENEFYGSIRPKRRIHKGERPLTALLDRGVEYVEVRCLDVNPFLPVGIDAMQARYIDTFLIACLLRPSEPDSPAQSDELQDNQLAIVQRGREPGLQLVRDGVAISMHDWATQLLDDCATIGKLLDTQQGNDRHSFAIDCQRKKLLDAELTPSARMLQCMREQEIPYFRFAMNQSLAHSGYFADHPLRDRRATEFKQMAKDSLHEQRTMEAASTETFEAFLEHYLALP